MINLFNILISITICKIANSMDSIRGLDPSYFGSYAHKEQFSCLDGSLKIPFNYVNDDYCDCKDSSDEPGTSACPNGKFYCINKGYRATIIPSSRVGDSICDCCDGSDEYAGYVQCENTCNALGEELQRQLNRENKLREQGYQLYLQYSKDGRQAKDDKKIRLFELKNERESLEVKKYELQEVVSQHEAPEKEAKERHEKAWQDTKEKLKREKSEAAAQITFDELDSNKDGHIEVNELQQHLDFDIDKNGEVSVEEAKEHLEDHDRLEFQEFFSKVWENIENLYSGQKKNTPASDEDKDKKLTEPVAGETEHENEETAGSDNDEDDDNDDDKEENEDGVEKDKDAETKAEEEMPPYDDETQKLIQVADEARASFNEVDSKLKDVEREYSEATQLIEADDGPNHEFQPLRGKCFDFDSREYTYTLCPFDRASQKSKSNSMETSLGMWGKWVEENGSPHGAMLYEKGQNCWNGPDRSAKVILECGLSNEMLSVSEPSRCEYLFTFSTPASCSESSVSPTPDTHIEL